MATVVCDEMVMLNDEPIPGMTIEFEVQQSTLQEFIGLGVIGGSIEFTATAQRPLERADFPFIRALLLQPRPKYGQPGRGRRRRELREARLINEFIQELERTPNIDDLEAVKQQLAAMLPATQRPDRFDCPRCGPGVAADEDGCCALCGQHCNAYEDGKLVVRAEPAEEVDDA